MDLKTIILIAVGLITIGAMIYCIMRDNNIPTETRKEAQSLNIVDDQSESNYDTIDEAGGGGGKGDESVYDSV